MSINHNRIKVADLEKNLPNKILNTNSDGELQFSDIDNISYNNLDYTLAGKTLDARQGKVLKDYIDNGLATATNPNFKGKYTSLVNLQTAHPTASDGDYAIVDAGSGTDAVEYIWDANEEWVSGSSIGSNGLGYSGLYSILELNPPAAGSQTFVVTLNANATAFVVGDYVKIEDVGNATVLKGFITEYIDDNLTVNIDRITGSYGQDWQFAICGQDGLGYSGLTSDTYLSPSLYTEVDLNVNLDASLTAFKVGDYIQLYSSTASGMTKGYITNYVGTTITFIPYEDSVYGSAADWVISLAGVRGNSGANGANGSAVILAQNYNTFTSTIGVTTEQIMVAIQFSGSAIKNNSRLELRAFVTRPVIGNTGQVRFYISDNPNNLSSAYLIALWSNGLNYQPNMFRRDFFIDATGNIIGHDETTTATNQFATDAISDTSVKYMNKAVYRGSPSYLIVTITTSGTGNLRLSGLTLESNK